MYLSYENLKMYGCRKLIHNPPQGGSLHVSRVGRDSRKSNIFKGKYEANLEFSEGWVRGSNQKPSMREWVRIFSGATQELHVLTIFYQIKSAPLFNRFLITPPSGRGLVIPIFFRGFCFFLVVTCPRPPVFARPNKYSCVFRYTGKGFYLE